MRKIKKPKLTIKAREVFYHLKRAKRLGSLAEETIEEILNEAKPENLVDPGCLYENISSSEAVKMGFSQAPGTSTWAIATIGDLGYEALLDRSQGSADAGRYEVLRAWGEILLGKLFDFAGSLIEKEAQAESLEVGPSKPLKIDDDQKVFEFFWQKLQPETRIGVRRMEEPASRSIKIWPVLTKIWTIPWLTKKEKRELALQNS